MVAADEHLRPHRFGADFHQGQKTVRRGAGDYFQNPALGKGVKGRDEILLPAVVPVVLSVFQTGEVKAGDLVELAVVWGAFDFTAGKIHQAVEVGAVALDQQGIPQHVAEGWG